MSKVIMRLFLFLLCAHLAIAPVFAQVSHAGHKMRSLKGLKEVAVVYQPTVESEILSMEEVHNLVKSILTQHIPELQLKQADDTANWLVLTYITTEHSAFVELSLERWVRILASGEKVVAKVWDKPLLVGFGSGREKREKRWRDAVKTLANEFGADYVRANR